MGTFRIAGFLAFCLMAMSASAMAQPAAGGAQVSPTYMISPGDQLRVFVWKNPDLTVDVPVRPDGKISTPLVADMQAQGKTPSGLAADLTTALGNYIQNPVVTVLVTTVGVANASSVRVIGAAATPKALPYRAGMTALDAVIEVGGLTTFASGNNAVLDPHRWHRLQELSVAPQRSHQGRRHGREYETDAGRRDPHSGTLVLSLTLNS